MSRHDWSRLARRIGVPVHPERGRIVDAVLARLDTLAEYERREALDKLTGAFTRAWDRAYLAGMSSRPFWVAEDRHEFVCPCCGATIRARMADTPPEDLSCSLCRQGDHGEMECSKLAEPGPGPVDYYPEPEHTDGATR